MKTKPVANNLLTITAAILTLIAVIMAAVRYLPLGEIPNLPEEHQPIRVADSGDYSLEGARYGSQDPLVTIVVFSDYGCRHCASANVALLALSEQFSREVAVVWRHFPALGERSFGAAIASECARQAGYFEAMHGRIFANIDSIGIDWLQVAHEIGIADSAGFSLCLSDESTALRVTRDMDAGRELGVRGVPSVLVDTLLFLGTPSMNYLQAYVRHAVRDSRRNMEPGR